MKKFLTLLLIVATMLIQVSIPSYADSQIKIGMFSGTDAKNAKVGSASGFNIKLNDKWVAQLPNTTIIVSSYANYYTVIEKSGFNNIEECINYINTVSPDCVPYYHANGFHAAKGWFTDYKSAETRLLETRKHINPEAYITNPGDNALCISSEKPLLIIAAGVLRTEPKNSPVTLNDSAYRGVMEFIGNGEFITAISVLSLEEYLYGVVSCEIGSDAPLEAKKAQAVCARTYATVNLGKHSSEGFDLCCTQDCQVYGGMATENPETIKAVDDTAHQLLKHNGNLVNTFYSASCGGKTADSVSVWKDDYEYLKSVADDGCESYIWEEKLNYNKISFSLSKMGKSIGKITDINITKRAEDGSVTKMEFTGEYGSAVVEKEAIRNLLGVKSQYFDFTQEKHEIKIPVTKQEEKGYPYISHKYSVEDMITKGILMNCDELVLTETLSTKSKIKGYGYGHRVGMCQLGAINHANNGWDYHKILAHYYNGSKIN